MMRMLRTAAAAIALMAAAWPASALTYLGTGGALNEVHNVPVNLDIQQWADLQFAAGDWNLTVGQPGTAVSATTTATLDTNTDVNLAVTATPMVLRQVAMADGDDVEDNLTASRLPDEKLSGGVAAYDPLGLPAGDPFEWNLAASLTNLAAVPISADSSYAAGVGLALQAAWASSDAASRGQFGLSLTATMKTSADWRNTVLAKPIDGTAAGVPNPASVITVTVTAQTPVP